MRTYANDRAKGRYGEDSTHTLLHLPTWPLSHQTQASQDCQPTISLSSIRASSFCKGVQRCPLQPQTLILTGPGLQFLLESRLFLYERNHHTEWILAREGLHPWYRVLMHPWHTAFSVQSNACNEPALHHVAMCIE